MKLLSRRDLLRAVPLALLMVSPFAAAQQAMETLDISAKDAPTKAAHAATGTEVEAPPQYTRVTDGSELNWAVDGTHQELWAKIKTFFGSAHGRYDKSYNPSNTVGMISDQVLEGFQVNEAYVLLQDNLRMFVGYRMRGSATKAFVITPQTSKQILGVALIFNWCPPGGSSIHIGSTDIPTAYEQDPSVVLFLPPHSLWLTDIKNAVEWYMTTFLSQTPIIYPADGKAYKVKIFLREITPPTS